MIKRNRCYEQMLVSHLCRDLTIRDKTEHARDHHYQIFWGKAFYPLKHI